MYTVLCVHHIIWYDMIHLLTAVGLSPGGSSTVHIYTQTINRTTQNQQYIDQHNNCGRIIRTRRSAYRRGLASVLESCLAMFCTWYLCPVCWLRLLTLSITHYVSVCCLTSLLRTPPSLSLSLSLSHTHAHAHAFWVLRAQKCPLDLRNYAWWCPIIFSRNM